MKCCYLGYIYEQSLKKQDRLGDLKESVSRHGTLALGVALDSINHHTKKGSAVCCAVCVS